MPTNDDSGGIQWQNEPPSIPLDFVPIYSAVPEANLHLICLSASLVGVWTHFHLQRTIPCIGKHKGCICGDLDLGRRWKGYLGAWDPLLSRVCLAEITLDCHRSCATSFARLAGEMRGLAFYMWRLGNRRNSPMRIQFGCRLPNHEERLPAAPDVMRCLRRIWRCPE